MTYYIIFIIFFFYSFSSYAADIKIINLHDNIKNNEKNTTEIIISDEKLLSNQDEEEFIDITEEELAENLTHNDELKLSLEEFKIRKKNYETLINNNSKDSRTESVKNLPDFWQNSDKDDLEFLFSNLKINNSKILTRLLLDTMIQYINAPKVYSQAEFDNLRVRTLINLGQREKALALINNINTYDNYKNYYDLLKLNYYFSINDLTKACNFKESYQENLDEKNNILLKINIFCSFIQNNIEEADLLNSLLLDTNDNDEYFQKIYFNLKNNSNELINISSLSFKDESFALYSSMLRIGSIPLNEKFLEYDPINFSLPIILSSSTDILLRLISAHKAYELGLLNAESLSALYRSVDFTYEQLNGPINALENSQNKPEIGMAFLFQKANVQLLPITRLESLKEFWYYAKINNKEILAYDISRDLIKGIEPSEELSEYALLIARAHTHNKNFILAEKWILFAENYIYEDSNLNVQELQSIKLLYNLKTSENDDSFVKILLAYLYGEESKFYELKNIDSLNNEILTTILSVIIENTNPTIILKENKRLLDERIMPSRYIIEKIINSSNSNEVGELILSTNISMNGKLWNEIHPYHLKTILEAFQKVKLNNIFSDLIIEILEEIKII